MQATATRSVLVVDDEKLIRWSLSEGLRKDYSVVTAASAEEALAYLARIPVDLVITDLRMPGMHGLEFIDLLRSHRPDLKVFAISAYAGETLAKELMSRGVSGVLPKPFEMKQVREMLAKQVS